MADNEEVVERVARAMFDSEREYYQNLPQWEALEPHWREIWRGRAATAIAVMREGALVIKPEHEAADAFWGYWRENGETHRHGYYESSTWGAINAAIRTSGLTALPSPPEGTEI